MKDSFTVNEDQYIAEPESHGIEYGFLHLMPGIIRKINNNEDIIGEIVAEGKNFVLGKEFIFMLHMEINDNDLEENKIDLRSAQNRHVVDPGDIIAELRYEDGLKGFDIFNKEVYAKVIRMSILMPEVG